MVGPRGVGKSRLLQEVARYATWRGLRVSQFSESSHRWTTPEPRLVLADPLPLSVPDSRTPPIYEASATVLLLAASRSEEAVASLDLAPDSILRLHGLEDAAAMELLQHRAGGAFEPVWTLGVIRRTRAIAGDLVAEAVRRRIANPNERTDSTRLA